MAKMIWNPIETYEKLLVNLSPNLDCEFYGLPEILWCYTTAQSNAKLVMFQNTNTKIFLRTRGEYATIYLIQGKFEKTDFEQLKSELPKHGVFNIKFETMLRNLKSTIPEAKKVPTWILDKTWEFKNLDQETRRKFKCAKRDFEYRKAEEKDMPLIKKLLEEWIVIAKKRYFIVNRGPYRKMIDNCSKLKNMELYLLIHKESKEVCGFFDAHKDANLKQLFPAQGKHNFKYKYAGRALNIFFMDMFVNEKYVYSNFGDTCDTMKRECGLKKIDSYTVDTIKLEKIKSSFGGYFK